MSDFFLMSIRAIIRTINHILKETGANVMLNRAY